MGQEEFTELCTELGLMIPQYDVERLYAALSKKLKWKGKAKEVTATNVVIAAYFDAYRERFGSDPMKDPVAMSRLKAIVKLEGAEKIAPLMRTYLNMRDQYFETKGYDLGTFCMNITKIARFHDTGQMTTRKAAQSAESHQGTVGAIKRYLAKGGLPNGGSNDS